MKAAILVLAGLFAGCAPKPALNTYRLVPSALVPPEVPGPEVAHRTFIAPVLRAKGSCAVAPGPIQLQPRKRSLRLTVDAGALAQQKQPGWLSDWTLHLEAEGCVALGEGQKLGRAIVESVPLDSLVAFRLLHANDIQNGYVDLTRENRVEVRSPILRESDAPIGDITAVSGSGARVNVDLKLSDSVVGFETDWYALEPNTARPGLHFAPISADRNVQGVTEHSPAPATDRFPFPPQAAYFRLFYKRDDNGVTAIVISGATRPDLETRTKAIGAEPAACERQAGMCLVLPKRVGVNPFLVVTINGKEVPVSLGATVRTALVSAGMRAPETVLDHLRVTRLFAGQPRPVDFNPKTQQILSLKLAGGEAIDW